MSPSSAANTPPDAAARKREIYRQAFLKYDRDGSNAIDAAELESLLLDLGWQGITEQDVTQALSVLDKDGNGEIDLDEFLNWSAYSWEKFVLQSPVRSPKRATAAAAHGEMMESLSELPEMEGLGEE